MKRVREKKRNMVFMLNRKACKIKVDRERGEERESFRDKVVDRERRRRKWRHI